jgi:hypothetical protein
LVHFARDLESAHTFANTLLNVPIKIVKDTVNIALNTFGRVRHIIIIIILLSYQTFAYQTVRHYIREFIIPPHPQPVCLNSTPFFVSLLPPRHNRPASHPHPFSVYRLSEKQARGIASQAKGVAIEALGEARTIVKDVRNKGLYGLVGLFGSGGGGAPGRGAGRGST